MTVAALALWTLIIYHNYPLSMDEYAAVFQSKIFASGDRCSASCRMISSIGWWFAASMVTFLIASPETGRAIAAYWPGFALLLAPFQFLGIPWLCNALLSGLSSFSHLLDDAEITADRRAAGWAMLFALASGAFLADGISYYSMQAHLAANLLFVALLMRPSKYRALGAGLVGSLALILHNPVPHALFALHGSRRWRSRRSSRNLLPLLLGYLPGVALGLGWLMFRTEISVREPRSAALGEPPPEFLRGRMWSLEHAGRRAGENVRVGDALAVCVCAFGCVDFGAGLARAPAGYSRQA